MVLLERRGVLGGRATSYRDALSGEDVDNGTHLMVGAYTATLDLAARAGAADLLELQPNLRIDFIDDAGLRTLECPALPAPFHLLAGLFSFDISWRARRDAARLAWAARFGKPPVGLTADQWFEATGQGEEIRTALWDPLVRAIVNEDTQCAAAILFYNVFREAFLRGRAASSLLFLKAGFAVLHERLAAHFVARGGVLRRRATALAVQARDGRACSVLVRQGAEGRASILAGAGGGRLQLDADAVVLAVPYSAVRRLVPEEFRIVRPFDLLDSFGGAPIVSVDVWIDRLAVPYPMVGLRDETSNGCSTRVGPSAAAGCRSTSRSSSARRTTPALAPMPTWWPPPSMRCAATSLR